MTQLINIADLGPNPTMAHVLVHLGVFPSLSQARKNGWDKPIILGKQMLTKKRISVEIINDDRKSTEKVEKIELTPDFWPNYEEPESELARAIQFPMNHDDVWSLRVLNAYMKDAREKRSRKNATV